jgi:FkbM family methyltransferase
LFERWRPRRTAGQKLLEAFAEAYPEARFLEIGAGDGLTADHLRPFVVSNEWRGIMVEPVPYVFEELQRNYAEVDRVALENVAIAERDGTLPFYHFAEPTPAERADLPDNYHLVGSASRDLLLRQTDVPDREHRIVETVVPCMTVESVARKHGFEGFDLVVIDAEGRDAEILGQLDLHDTPPRILVYEDVHLSPEQRAACERRLHAVGYETMVEAFDTWCLDTRAGDSLSERWRELCRSGPAVSREDLERWFDAVSGRS